MKRKQFSEEQIIGILKEAEAGAAVTELCRKHGMSSATYYARKAKFGGLEVSDAKRQAVAHLHATLGMSERRACMVVGGAPHEHAVSLIPGG
jgi:transposase-like protein